MIGLIDPVDATNMLDYLSEHAGYNKPCFPADTLITLSDGQRVAIQDVEAGHRVAAMAGAAAHGDPGAALGAGIVSKIFRNITEEWVELRWEHPQTDVVEQIIAATPGHRFLTPGGEYKRLVDMVDRRGASAAGLDVTWPDAQYHIANAPASADDAARPVGAGPTQHVPGPHLKPLGTAQIVLEDGQW